MLIVVAVTAVTRALRRTNTTLSREMSEPAAQMRAVSCAGNGAKSGWRNERTISGGGAKQYGQKI